MLFRSGRLRQDIPVKQYLDDLIQVLSLSVLPITPDIAVTSQDERFIHKDPAHRLIAATAIVHNAPLISADSKLQNIQKLKVIW